MYGLVMLQTNVSPTPSLVPNSIYQFQPFVAELGGLECHLDFDQTQHVCVCVCVCVCVKVGSCDIFHTCVSNAPDYDSLLCRTA